MVILLVDNLIEDHDLKMAVEVSFFFPPFVLGLDTTSFFRA